MLNLNLLRFIEQTKQEVARISVPTKQEMVASTLIVIVVIAVFSVVCMFVDYGIHSVIQILLRLGI